MFLVSCFNREDKSGVADCWVGVRSLIGAEL